MKLTTIGTGGVFPKTDRRQSCAAIETNGETIVFDLGNGAVRGLLRAGLDPLSIDRLFITHLHPDHTSDIPALLFSMNYGMAEERTKPLRISGPRPFGEFLGSLKNVWGEWIEPDFPVEVSELPVEAGHRMELPDGTLSWAPAEHNPESIAYRLDSGGASLVYTGDTEYAESIVELARGADTLLIECSAPDDAPIPGHLTPSSVAKIAAEAGVGRVVLTHLFPPVLELDLAAEVGKNFDGEIVVSGDGMKLEV